MHMAPRCRSEYASSFSIRACSLVSLLLVIAAVLVNAREVTTPNSNSTSNQSSVTSSKHRHVPGRMLAAGAIRGLQGCGARKCLKISQHSTGPNSMYNVQIINICQDCYLCHVRAYCPEFITSMAVDPNVFRRVSKDSCQIKKGHGVYPNEMLLFTYGASFPSDIQPATSKACRARRRRHRPRHGK